MDRNLIKIDYDNTKPKAIRFMKFLIEQLSELIEKEHITLDVPLDGRIKTFASIEEKAVRKNKNIHYVTDLDDFVGIRIIVLFKSDIDTIGTIIKSNFDIVDVEDVAERLSDDQFGYQSNHYTVKLQHKWFSLPTLSDLGDLKAEIQVRTLSQHIWAVASHKLQYKQEKNIPLLLRRSINRVSALLETVDFEFERVLSERKSYRERELQIVDDTSGLDVVVLEALADSLLPDKNKDPGNEEYSVLLDELISYGYKVSTFKSLIKDNLEKVMQKDRERVNKELAKCDEDTDQERLAKGVFFTHVGIVRGCLKNQLGDAYKAPASIDY